MGCDHSSLAVENQCRWPRSRVQLNTGAVGLTLILSWGQFIWYSTDSLQKVIPQLAEELHHTLTHARTHARTHTHTHTCLLALGSGLPGWAGTRKVKPIWILLKRETVSGSGVSWAICNSAPHFRHITTSAPHHSVFYRLGPFLSPNQHRQSTEELRHYK